MSVCGRACGSKYEWKSSMQRGLRALMPVNARGPVSRGRVGRRPLQGQRAGLNLMEKRERKGRLQGGRDKEEHRLTTGAP